MRPHGATALAIGLLLLLPGCERQRARIDPHDKAVVAAHDRALQDIAADVTAVQAIFGDSHEFAHIEANTCQVGEYNWSVKDLFYSRCELHVAVGLAFDGDFRQQAKALDRLLASRGWTEPCGDVTGRICLGVSHSLDSWDGEDRSIGGLPRADYRRGESQLWIIFGSTETPGDRWLHDVDCDLARGTDTKCTFTPINAYYSESTGTPWATAWENAGRPGPLMIVLHFGTVYQQDLR
jgi:hypothetical protein